MKNRLSMEKCDMKSRGKCMGMAGRGDFEKKKLKKMKKCYMQGCF